MICITLGAREDSPTFNHPRLSRYMACCSANHAWLPALVARRVQ